jgi:hypothetical protein
MATSSNPQSRTVWWPAAIPPPDKERVVHLILKKLRVRGQTARSRQVASDPIDAHVRVQLDEMTGRIAYLSVSRVGGFTPTELQRFPWKSLLGWAEGAYRGENEYLKGVISAQAEGRSMPRRRPRITKHPGRPGHPDEHYRVVAEEYLGLWSEGCASPTATIARKRGVSRDTVARWVSGARRRGYLAPAKPGRAG